MRFKATDVFDYDKPSRCEKRVALRARGEPEQVTDTPFVDLLRTLGHRHEKTSDDDGRERPGAEGGIAAGLAESGILRFAQDDGSSAQDDRLECSE